MVNFKTILITNKLSTKELDRDFAPKSLCAKFCQNRSKCLFEITITHTHTQTKILFIIPK